MKIAYFVNQYPKVSHSFIRREILALERQGLHIKRYSLRGWDAELVDAEDLAERERTRFVLQQGVGALLGQLLSFTLRRPRDAFRGLKKMLQLAQGGDRTWAHHFIALAEGVVLSQWMNDDGIEHVHAHFGTNSAEVVMLAHAVGGPGYSFTLHGPEEWDMPVQFKLREKIRDARFVVGISSFAAGQVFRWARPEDWDKVHVVHCGIEPAFHDTKPVPVPDNCRMVCIGRLCKEKAQGLLIQAVGRLKERGIPVELVLAGDGEMRPAIEALIAKLGLGSQVRITGWISGAQVREELMAARALVLPSLMEGLPVVIMEAMALRRPVLTTYIAGIPELVRNEQDGWLFPAGSLDELTNAMAACLATPVQDLRTMGESGRTRVLERHDIDVEVAKLLKQFRRVVANAAQ